MTQKIFIGKISKGQEQFYLPFNIDDDAFPNMYNAYTWRGRVKRKRGTTTLGRLQIQVQLSASPNNWQYPQFALVAGAGNLLTAIGQAVPASIVPGTINITVGANTYTEPAMPDGTLVGMPAGSGTINYATGDITIAGGGASNVTGKYAFYPDLPVMGLRDLISGNTQYPLLLSFDTKYAYQILQQTNANPTFYGINYYKKSNNPVTWSGLNYQQFWSTNYQGAFWTVNNNPGMRISWVHACANQVGTSIVMQLFNQADNAPLQTLQINDYLYFNEGTGVTWTLNGQTGFISLINNMATGTYTVTFPTVQTVNGYIPDTALGQLLTSQATGTGDGIRWYDGDPTGGTGLPVPGNTTGWVNFAPPLTSTTTSIDDETSALYYLVGALAVVPFKDRLLFMSPYIQTSSQAKNGIPPIQLNDVVLWSWNGTPYYSSLTPVNETSRTEAYYVDQTGFGGWISAGINQNITSVNNNEDVLLIGFTNRQTRFIYTSNDLYPFLFYIINSELGTSSTFSAITLDRGALSYGADGFILTSQVSAQRIDLQIPNKAFEFAATTSNNAAARVSAARDFFHEWIHFTFVPQNSPVIFPTQTLQYNYREETWALLYENFTAQGEFRKLQGFTWSSNPWNASMMPWDSINESWNSSIMVSLFPTVVAGNPQGFVVLKNEGTAEAPTGSIQAISNSSGFTQITCYNHCVSATNGPLGGGDYLYFLGSLGLTYLNDQIGQVTRVIDDNNFVIDIPFQAGSYLGLGTFTRLIQPIVQTKQFPIYWNEGRKIRVGAQKYLLDRTINGQVSLFIFLSQDPDHPWNNSAIVPNIQSTNNSLIYSTILYTCPESTNIGLDQFTQSINNPNPESGTQFQIWHRVNTSLIGDTFQLGITLSDEQMRVLDYAIGEISLHAIQIDVGRGPLLA